jgi:hypothetical protein
MPHLAAGCIRVEVECPASTTGLTQVPGLMQALTMEQMVTAAVYAHEERCGFCDTEPAHAQGDRQVREQTDRAWDELLAAAQQRYDTAHRN